jgi:hypothetical protein
MTLDRRTFISMAALPALYPLPAFGQTRSTAQTISTDNKRQFFELVKKVSSV